MIYMMYIAGFKNWDSIKDFFKWFSAEAKNTSQLRMYELK